MFSGLYLAMVLLLAALIVRGVAFESYERAIDAHIKNVRKKVGQHYIETVFGVGYRFAEPNG